MFYSTLGNVGAVDASNIGTGCLDLPTFCLTNTGPLIIETIHPYWYGQITATDPTFVWNFNFREGGQYANFSVNNIGFAWQVIDGDPLAPVPIPAAAWLFGGALGLLGVARRRAAA